MDAVRFAHLAYGEIVKQFGLGSTHQLLPWDQLPDNEKERWMSVFAVVHAEVFPHGDPNLHPQTPEVHGRRLSQ
jgi:hypothetical protein